MNKPKTVSIVSISTFILSLSLSSCFVCIFVNYAIAGKMYV